MIEIGEKVVAVLGNGNCGVRLNEAPPGVYWTSGEIPKIGNVYVVRKLHISARGSLGISVIGGSVGTNFPYMETGWHHSCFRKLDEIKMENALKKSEGQGVVRE